VGIVLRLTPVDERLLTPLLSVDVAETKPEEVMPQSRDRAAADEVPASLPAVIARPTSDGAPNYRQLLRGLPLGRADQRPAQQSAGQPGQAAGLEVPTQLLDDVHDLGGRYPRRRHPQ
jgi:hypothetical protein